MIALEPQGLHVQYRISYIEYFDCVLDMIKRCHSGGATIRNPSQRSPSCADCSHLRRFPWALNIARSELGKHCRWVHAMQESGLSRQPLEVEGVIHSCCEIVTYKANAGLRVVKRQFESIQDQT